MRRRDFRRRGRRDRRRLRLTWHRNRHLRPGRWSCEWGFTADVTGSRRAHRFALAPLRQSSTSLRPLVAVRTDLHSIAASDAQRFALHSIPDAYRFALCGRSWMRTDLHWCAPGGEAVAPARIGADDVDLPWCAYWRRCWRTAASNVRHCPSRSVSMLLGRRIHETRIGVKRLLRNVDDSRCSPACTIDRRRRSGAAICADAGTFIGRRNA